MKTSFKKPYLYFWITAVYILVPQLLLKAKLGDSALDINLHDTYFVMDSVHISIVLFSFYLVLGLLYFIFQILKIELKPILTASHTIITVGSVYAFDIINQWILFPNKENILFGYASKFNNTIVILCILVALSQILFLINIIWSSIINFRKRHKN